MILILTITNITIYILIYIIKTNAVTSVCRGDRAKMLLREEKATILETFT